MLPALDLAARNGQVLRASVGPHGATPQSLRTLTQHGCLGALAEITVIAAPNGKQHEGKALADCLSEGTSQARAVTAASVAERLLNENVDVSVAVQSAAAEQDEEGALRHEAVMIASDLSLAQGQREHSRQHATFTSALADAQRRGHDLAQIVHKMSQGPANFYQMQGRGVIEPGAAADLVLLDMACVGAARGQGIKNVWCNGRLVLENGKPTGATPGRVIRRGPAP